MTLAEFRDELLDHDGRADVWLVYSDDVRDAVMGNTPSLVLEAAFWTRGAAYAYAQRVHQQRSWRRLSVFRVTADVPWAIGGTRRAAEFEAAFGRSSRILPVVISGAEIAAKLQV
jgi:hypothetical protein